MNGGSQWDDLQRELEGGVVRRSSQLIAAGVCPAVIADALRRGRIAKAAPGAYYLPQPDVLGWEMAVAAACSRMPRAVACLLTAAQLHELVPARAAEAPLWFGLSPSDHAGKAGGVPYRILRWSWRGAGEMGVQRIAIRGVDAHVTDAARTVVDLFRYSRLIDASGATAVSAARSLASKPGGLERALDTAAQVGLPGPASERLRTAIQALA